MGDIGNDAVSLRLGDREHRGELSNGQVGSHADAADEHAALQRCRPGPAAALTWAPERTDHGVEL